MNLTEKTIEKITKFSGRIINVRQDVVEAADGSVVSREVVEHNGGVCVAAITDKNEILLVRQFRYPYMAEVDEIPAGKLEKGEDPLEGAKRELLEETGYTAGKIRKLTEMYPSPGYTTEIIHIYLAEDLTFEGQQLDDGEFLYVKKIPLNKAVKLFNAGKLPDAKTQIAVLWLNSLRNQD